MRFIGFVLKTGLIAIFILGITVFNKVMPQQPSSIFKSNNEDTYVASFWKEGIFDHPAIRSFTALNLTNPYYAIIHHPDTALTILFLSGVNKRGDTSYHSAVINDRDRTIKINEILFDGKDETILKNQLELILDEDGATITPIEIQVIPENQSLLYRWSDTKSNTITAGPKPVENPALLKKGSPLPNFKVKALDADSISTLGFKDKIVVINWWGTWCKPCVDEIPGLNTLVTKYSGKDQIAFLAIASDTEETLRSFLQKKPFDYLQTFQDSFTAKLFGMAYPRNVIVNTEGIVIYDKIGGYKYTYREIETVLVGLLKKE